MRAIIQYLFHCFEFLQKLIGRTDGIVMHLKRICGVEEGWFGGHLGGFIRVARNQQQRGHTAGQAFAALKQDGSVVTWGESDRGGDSSSVATLLASGIVALANPFTDDVLD